MTIRLALLILITLTCAARGEEPRFGVEVMATLSKAGCNAGVCHGNQNGKGGFKLSLRGQDPAADFARLTREAGARRIDRFNAETSLILAKPSGRAPHGGGVRLPKNSRDYDVLRRWIANGAPGPDESDPKVRSLRVKPTTKVVWSTEEPVLLHVEAEFDDGTKRDVTANAVYESTELFVEADAAGRVTAKRFGESTVIVRYLDKQQPVTLAFLPQRTDYAWPGLPALNVVDQCVDKKLKRLKTSPSPVCSDSVFIRRVYLDALGVTPAADESRWFVQSQDDNKRSQLIDRVLARPEFADHWALKWSDILRNEEKVLDKKGVAAFHSWIRASLAEAKPIDQFVRELVLGRGSTYKSPAANFYRANRKPTTRGETTARLFLGVRLQCAQCHNHPFDVWTQDDYYDWASLFARIDYKIVENKRRDKFDKNEFIGEQIVMMKDKGDVTNARTGENAHPRFLGGGPLDPDGDPDRLQQLASWLTSPENKLFVRSQANWIWFQLMGRGVVEPVDDFRLTNPPSNPELLDALALELSESGFDLRSVVRLIMNSRTYQASSVANATNALDERNYSRTVVRRLSAEQLLDAQSRVLGAPTEFNGYDVGTRAAQIQGVQRLRVRDKPPSAADRFLTMFGKPQRLLACECERSSETSLNQALELIAGQSLHALLEHPDNRLSRMVADNAESAAVVDELFWAAFARPPTETELAACVKTIDEADDPLEGARDVAWALLNAKAFIYRE